MRSTTCCAARWAPTALAPTGHTLTLRARHFVVAGGAINTPGLLLRSNAPNPRGLLGTRTFLHPTVVSARPVRAARRRLGRRAAVDLFGPFPGRPQPIDGPIGYKLEAPPMHPVLMATTLAGFGQAHVRTMQQFPHQHALLALLRDGFHADSRGGSVALQANGAPVLDYPITPYLWDGVRRALLSMAEIQFAAGAKSVLPVHEMAERYTSWAAAKQGIAALPLKTHITRVVSAHVMGGCAMAADDRLGLVGPDGRYHGVRNLSVHDGSLFPTSLGANPQLSIYAISARLASGLARSLTGKPAPRLVA